MGKQYNNSLEPNQYSLVNTNIEFFSGNQWLHMPDTEAMRRLPKPTFNIIKRVASLFIASLTSSNTTINFEPLAYYDGENLKDESTNAADFATAEVRNLLEKFKMDYRIRDALYDGAITGDYCAHFFWNPEAMPYGGAFSPYKGEIEMELVDGINVMFGNPNTKDVESQPYILIVGRDTIGNLRRETNNWKRISSNCSDYESNPDYILPDAEYYNMSGMGGRTELHTDDELAGKALYVYLYTKVWKEIEYVDPRTGRIEKRLQPSVHVTKATRNCYIFKDVDTGLSRYPIAWGNWEKQKNQYHGRALVTGIVPNQISINLMMAMAVLHTELESFPIRLFNADFIPSISNEVGATIGVRNLQPDQSLNQLIATIQPADMSSQILVAIDKVMTYTKECLGATDAQLGNVKPDNTSALMVLQSSAEVPLENIRAGLHEWIEDIGAILLDMMGTYYGKRPVMRERIIEEFVVGKDGKPLIDPMSGQMATQSVKKKVMEEFDFSQFKNLWLNISVDVGATTYYSEIAMVQTLDNLRRDGTLDVIEYLERIPDKLIPRKADLIAELRNRSGLEDLTASKPPSNIRGSPSMGGELDAAKKIAQLPTAMQAKYNSLPSVAQRSLSK